MKTPWPRLVNESIVDIVRSQPGKPVGLIEALDATVGAPAGGPA